MSTSLLHTREAWINVLSEEVDAFAGQLSSAPPSSENRAESEPSKHRSDGLYSTSSSPLLVGLL